MDDFIIINVHHIDKSPVLLILNNQLSSTFSPLKSQIPKQFVCIVILVAQQLLVHVIKCFYCQGPFKCYINVYIRKVDQGCFLTLICADPYTPPPLRYVTLEWPLGKSTLLVLNNAGN